MDAVQTITAELDERHRQARTARLRKDYGAYADVFSPKLIFQPKMGTAIDRDRLMRNVRAHDRRFKIVDTEISRTKIHTNDDAVIEVLVQTAIVQVNLFLGLRYQWTLVRESEFVWERSNRGWQIRRAQIQAELIKDRKFLW